MTPGDDVGMLKTILDYAWTVVLALIGVVWRQQSARIDDAASDAAKALEAHMQSDDRRFQALHEEQNLQRQHIAKLFDKLEEHSRRSEDRHVELLNALHIGLSNKADK